MKMNPAAMEAAGWAQDALDLTDAQAKRLAQALTQAAQISGDARRLRGAIALLITEHPQALDDSSMQIGLLRRRVERACHRWTWKLREPDRERIRAAWAALTDHEKEIAS